MSSQPYTHPAVCSLAWYALQVRSRREKAIAAALRVKGYEEFLPLYTSRRKWSDRIARVEVPLFPGYIFCRFDRAQPRLPILSTPGIIQIIGAGEAPAAIEPAEIDAIRTIVESGVAAQPWPYLKIGSCVRIEHGALTGMEGILVELKKQARLVVSVSLLQRSVAVEIERDWITLSTPPRGALPSV